MALSSIANLLACDPSDIAIAEFVGKGWGPLEVRNEVLEIGRAHV